MMGQFAEEHLLLKQIENYANPTGNTKCKAMMHILDDIMKIF